MIEKSRYNFYSPEVAEYMNVLMTSLENEYGVIKDEWLISLDMIAQTYSTYLLGWKSIQQDGMYVKDSKNRLQRNPALTVMNNSQSYLQKLLTQFALTPLAKSKIKKVDSADTTDDYIANLCGDQE